MRKRFAATLRALAARIDPPKAPCRCGNEKCDGVSFRPPYYRNFVPCPLNTAAMHDDEIERLREWLFANRGQ